MDKRQICKEKFPAFCKITMKFHNLEHYAHQLIDFGPFSCTWTARSEARHRDFVNYSESAKNFINLLKTVSEKNQKKVASRAFNGYFSEPEIQFVHATTPFASCPDLYARQYCKAGDLLTDAVIVKNTLFKIGHLVVTAVESDNVIQVGRIIKVVVRGKDICFLLSNYDAARTRFKFFEVISLKRVSLVRYSSIVDYKPLIGMGKDDDFKFVLHHHLPVKILD